MRQQSVADDAPTLAQQHVPAALPVRILAAHREVAPDRQLLLDDVPALAPVEAIDRILVRVALARVLLPDVRNLPGRILRPERDALPVARVVGAYEERENALASEVARR